MSYFKTPKIMIHILLCKNWFGLEKYMSFSINNKLSYIDRFQFLSSSLDSLVKNFDKDDFKYLSQEFDNNVLDLFKQKGFYLYEFMPDS